MQNDFPLVTIVTPSFNQAQFLERTIISVLSQDYPNIEYIVMDGGSTDGSTDIIRKYENKISYWVSEKDKGQSDAINKGWRRAKGVYCSYLNSDDVLFPDAVSRIVKAFLENPDAGIIHGDYTCVDENDTVLEAKQGKACDFKDLLINGQYPFIGQPSSFYLTSLVREVGYMDEHFHLSMDYDLLLKLAQKSKAVYIPHQLSLFRLHTNSKSATLIKQHWHESIKIKMKYSKFYFLKSIFFYARFRIFNLMPNFIQTPIRKKRNSFYDKMILRSD